MIQISVEKSGKHIRGLQISGHAGSDKYGKDLICAGVSAIGFGLLNAMDQLTDGNDLSAENNLIKIEISNPDDKTDTIMETGLIELETIAENNHDFIKINTEVH